MATYFDGFFQLGFVAHNLDNAVAALGDRYGVRQFRRKHASADMASAHAWVGSVMLEVLEIGANGPSIYRDFIPADGDAIRLHHHGFRVADEGAWLSICEAMENRGLMTEMCGSVMEGHLNYLYADTRRELGVYSEYIYLTGPALGIYDDVPRN